MKTEQPRVSAASLSERCRIVLVAPTEGDDDAVFKRMDQALGAGDVASIIVPPADEATFQQRAAGLVEIAHRHDVAAMVVADTRIAGRVKADGIHIETGTADAAPILEKFADTMMVGVGGIKTRHSALEAGEIRPDYVFFGRIGYDLKPDPHPRNMALAEWWAALVEVPCIVLAGSQLASVGMAAQTGADFVALSHAVFAPDIDPAEAVAEANAILERDAPLLDA